LQENRNGHKWVMVGWTSRVVNNVVQNEITIQIISEHTDYEAKELFYNNCFIYYNKLTVVYFGYYTVNY
jgi:hypothetical protein